RLPGDGIPLVRLTRRFRPTGRLPQRGLASGLSLARGEGMFTRVVQFAGAKDIDGGRAFVRDTVTPVLRKQNGFCGVTASADRSGGVLGVLTVWETEADRDASESAILKVREEGAKVIGGEMTVEFFEEMVVEMVGPPK